MAEVYEGAGEEDEEDMDSIYWECDQARCRREDSFGVEFIWGRIHYQQLHETDSPQSLRCCTWP